MNISIGKKILLGFGLIVALTIGLGWYGLVMLNEVREISTQRADKDIQMMKLLHTVSETKGRRVKFQEQAVKDYFLQKAGLVDSDPIDAQEAWRQAITQTQNLLTQVESNAAFNEKDAISTQRQEQWRKIRQGAQGAQEALSAVIFEVQRQFEFLNAGDLKQLISRTQAIERTRQAFNEKHDLLIDLTQQLVAIGKLETADVYDNSQFSILLALLIAILLGIGASFVIYRSVTRPLGEFTLLVEQVGNGNLSRQATFSGTDELGRLGQSLNEMINGLRDVAGQTRSATNNLNSATAEILASTQQQASGAAEQAASVQETSTTMEEVSESGAQIADMAKQVASSAEATSAASQSGIRAVQDMSQAMEAIQEQAEAVAENIVALSEKTQAVGEIIATVTDIAEQSNLLALNATIESVSAGEQGQRFAVVANEMKNLADQAKEATVQVRSILEEIQNGINTSVMLTEEAVKRVDSGRRQSGAVEDTISQMANSIVESVNTFQQIMAATNQQQIGFEQVNQALKDINQASNQTASSIQQLEKTAANINALGQQLQKAVERYQL